MKRASGLVIAVMLTLLFVTGCNTTNEVSGQSNELSPQASNENTAQNGATGSPKENSSHLVVDGEIIQFDTISILSDKISLLIPTTFSIMSEDMAKIKYPNERRPSIIYTNDSASVNIAFNYTQNQASNENLQAIMDSLKESFDNLYPSAQWYTSEVKTINDKDIGVLELITPAIDTEIYNLMWFTDIDGKLLIATFNCTKEQMDEWKPVGETILSSFELK